MNGYESYESSIVDMMRNNPGISVKEIAFHLGISLKTVQKWLTKIRASWRGEVWTPNASSIMRPTPASRDAEISSLKSQIGGHKARIVELERALQSIAHIVEASGD